MKIKYVSGYNIYKTVTVTQEVKKMLLYLYLFWIGGITYQIIELLWARHTHWSMFLAGGLCLILIDGIYNSFVNTIPILSIIVLCAVSITCVECVTGCIFNLYLKQNVWDYSKIKGNLLGQICPKYTLYWMILSIPAILFTIFIRSLFG